MIRIVIADNNLLVRRMVRRVLERETDFEVVEEAADGQAALGIIERQQPDVLVLDLQMPLLDGWGVIRSLAQAHSKLQILVCSLYVNPELVKRAVELGVPGYVDKPSTSRELVQAVRAVNAGRTYLSPKAAAALQLAA